MPHHDDTSREAQRARAALRAELFELKRQLQELLGALDQGPDEPATSAVVTSVVTRSTRNTPR
jgi:hypothetical protein